MKVVFDFIFALLGLIIFSPLIALTAVVLAIVNKGNPFFTQQRPGRDAKLFRIIKFKTMSEKTDDAGNLLPDEERLHFIGGIVRKTSIDELPQLINVLKGDMSLVGPRPLTPDYLALYSKGRQERQSVRPGITGWAQVNGRNTISLQDKFKFDLWYIRNLSMMLDLKILWLTFIEVLKLEE